MAILIASALAFWGVVSLFAGAVGPGLALLVLAWFAVLLSEG